MVSTKVPELVRLLGESSTQSSSSLSQGIAVEIAEPTNQAGRVGFAGRRGVSPIVPFGAGSDGQTGTIKVYGGVLFDTGSLKPSEFLIELGTLAVTLGTITGAADAAIGNTERFAKAITWTPTDEMTALASVYSLSPVARSSATAFSWLSIPDLAFVQSIWFDVYVGNATSLNLAYAAGN